MRRHHWSVYLSAALGGTAALVLVGPIAVAVVMLRCCSDSTGPTAAAWGVMALIVVAVVSLAALAGGVLCIALRRFVIRARR